MHQVAEFLAAEWIIPEVLDDGTAVRIGVGFLDLIVRKAGKAMLDERPDVRSPQQVDDFLVGENGVGRGRGPLANDNEKEVPRSRAQGATCNLPEARRDVELLRTT